MKKEEELIDEALQGNSSSFEILLRPYRQGILNMAYRMTGNLEDAKEICQETIFKIYRYLGNFKSGRSFKSWLFKAVINTSYDYLRKRNRERQLFEKQKPLKIKEAINPEHQLLRREIREKLQSSLFVLSPREKAVFLLRDGEGLSIKETSDALDCSSLSVRTHLSRARSKLRIQLEKIYPTGNLEVKSEL